MNDEERHRLVSEIAVTTTQDIDNKTFILRFEIPMILLQLGSIGLGRNLGQDMLYIANLINEKGMEIIKQENRHGKS